MPFTNNAAFQERFFRYAFRGLVGLTAATPVVAMFQGWYLLSDFRKNHRDAPFPDMPCSGVVVVHPLPHDDQTNNRVITSKKLTTTSSWFSSFPLLSEQKDPDPLRLLVVGDSLAAGVGVTKSGTPVLPEAIAKTLSRALGGRAVYWTCMGEPGLSSPQIVKELLLDTEEKSGPEKEKIDVMEELQDWWEERRHQQQEKEESEEHQTSDSEHNRPEGPVRLRAWWRKVSKGAKKDLENLSKRLRISEKIPEAAVVLPRRRNTVVPDLVAEYDVAVVITGFNDLKNLIFPLPQDPNAPEPSTQEGTDDEDGVSSSGWLEKDLLGIMRALKGKMRNYGFGDDTDKTTEGDISDTPKDPHPVTTPESNDAASETLSLSTPPRRHHPMVVFPATPLFQEKVYPMAWFAAPGVKLMEYQKKKLAQKYPAPVLFLEAPDDEVVKDFTNKRGPLWEARSREEVLFELTNKARLEQLEKLMKEYYERWTVDVEEEETTYTYDAFGPDIQGPMQHLNSRSPLISPDRVHPSDEGYDLWGRHIANAIVREWDRVEERENEDSGNLKN